MTFQRAIAASIFGDLRHRGSETRTSWGSMLTVAALFVLPATAGSQDLDELLGSAPAEEQAPATAPEPAPAAEAAPGAAPSEPAAVAPAGTRREIEEIIVTATKRGPESIQDVPIAVTAFGPAQLEAMSFHSLQSLSHTMPNVQLEDVGTVQGYANFSIRGQGINSSIPSIDPTVGVFIDGVYIGTSSGLVLDNFDLEGIEVLRGPQGVLFGRNVTGGAVLLRTKAPGDELEASARAALETGVTEIIDGSVSGPVLEDLLGVKVAAYYSDDPGWFTNRFDGSDHGAARTTLIRPAIRVTPFGWLDAMIRFETGEAVGDGPSTQNHALWRRGTFDFAVDEPGLFDSDWRQLSFEPNISVPFGNGTITSVTGWREYNLFTRADIDGTTDPGFHAQARLEQSQISEELRYAGSFGSWDVTTGGYYFTQDLLYIERRLLGGGAVDRTGGGDGEFSTLGVFGAADWSLPWDVTLNLGLRYTYEKKDVAVSTISTTRTASGGDVNAGTLVPNFFDDESWTDLTPKVGLQWRPIEATQVYGFWAKGFRSGGYNFRNTTDNTTPGPFDAEEQNSFEIGLKHDFPWLPIRLNAAVFRNEIKNLQRELNVPGSFGVSQRIVNAGEATIQGAEAEMRVFLLLENLSASLFGGYLDGEYNKVTEDLDRDGEVTASDKALEIPRLAPKTWGVALEHDLVVWTLGALSSRVSFSHRDKNFFTDSNQGFLDVYDTLDSHLAFISSSGRWTVSLYGMNLLDKASFGGHTPLPDDDPPLFALFGGDGPGPRGTPSFSPLNKGRVIGAQIRINY